MIAIIGAMEIEIELLKQTMQIEEEKVVSSMRFYKGKLYGKNTVIVKCGVGKANAAMCTQATIMLYNPRIIINPGVAGGIDDNAKIGCLIVGTNCVNHDYDTTAIGEKKGLITTNKGETVNFPCSQRNSEIFYNSAKEFYDGDVYYGIIASGDIFVADKNKCKEIHDEFNASACEMESAPIAQVAFLNDIPFVSLRSISDNANDNETVDFYEFATSSAHKTAKLVEKVFSNNLI